MSHIDVSAFQPFPSRIGVDTVLALRFQYDPDLIAALKDALQAARRRGFGKNLGGWLAEYRCWFVERSAWPLVADRLRKFGCTFTEPDSRPLASAVPEGGGEQGRRYFFAADC